MKKITLILALALTLVVAFAMSAMAAQNLDPSAAKGDTKSDYLPTTPAGLQSTINANKAAGQNDIHSNYTANTNACAACHATHTGVGGSLLQWADVETTCFACHDGSAGTTTYNVVGGTIGTTSAITFGGRFDVDSTGLTSVSMHNVGSTTIGAAPGGDDKALSTSKWGQAFECTSCHTPHGQGGNARILNPDVNNLATEGKVSKGALTLVTGNTYVAQNADGENVYQIQGYPYGSKVYASSAAATALKEGTDYTISNTKGYTEITFTATQTSPVADYFPAVKVNFSVTGKLTAGETVTYNNGINTFCGACHSDYNTQAGMSGSKTQVKYNYAFPLYKDAGLTQPLLETKGSGGELTGVYHEAYRHQVGYVYGGAAGAEAKGLKFEKVTGYYNNSGTTASTTVSFVVCTTCHVAHGTDQAFWASAKTAWGNGYAGYDGDEIMAARGSNLKRMPNMATCESCHQKGPGSAGKTY